MHLRTFVPAAQFDIIGFGELVAEPSRVAMLLSLMDGRARPASELAQIAGVTPATASVHLGRLLAGGLLSVEKLGRHRYYRLARDEIAGALEAISEVYPPRPLRLAPSAERQALVHARTCYKHLAGRLGVAWRTALEQARLLELGEGSIRLSTIGIAHFEALGLGVDRWPAGKLCLDWTERKSHLGGALGVLLTDHLFALGWLARQKDGRTVRVTTLGEREFCGHFGLRLEALRM